MVSAVVVKNQAESAWQQMTERSEQLHTQCSSLPTTRTPLWGEAQDDHAFAHYDAACEQITPFREGLRKHRQQWRELDDSAFCEAIREPRASWRPALLELRAGAHAQTVTRVEPFDPMQGSQLLLARRDMVNIAMLEARARRIEGEPLDGVHWLLDAATLGADHLHNGLLIEQMIGAAMLEIVVDECDDSLLTALPADAREHLAAGFAAIDERLPERLPLEREFTYMAAQLHNLPNDTDWGGANAWRFGFSSQWMVADAYLQSTSIYLRLTQTVTTSWPQRQRQLQRAEKAAASSWNPTMKAFFPGITSAETTLRRVIANLRMLRMALDLHRGIDREPLVDPLGEGPLQVVRLRDHVEIRSEGCADQPLSRNVVTG